MGSALHPLCPRYSGTLTHTAPTAKRLWETFTLRVIGSSGLIGLSSNMQVSREA